MKSAGDPVWSAVSLPAHYNASYLTLDEFDASLKHHHLELAQIPVEFCVLRMALSHLVGEHGAERVRLVVWFS